MADRIGIILGGELVLVEEKRELMRKLGKKQLTVQLEHPLASVPDALAPFGLELAEGGAALVYTYDSQRDDASIATLIAALGAAGIGFRDLHTTQSSLEDIFVSLVRSRA